MNKKLILSVILAGVLTAAVVLQVIAGAVFDYGTLAGKAEADPPPPEGAVNWIAYWRTFANGIPREILTEDSTNAEDGVDLGYSKGIINPDIVHWVLQIENFNVQPESYDPEFGEHNPIYIVFGGVGEEFSGTLWKYTIPYWLITESITNQDKVPIHTTEGAACPIIEAQPVSGIERTVYFSGQPNAYYLVYRSRNGSGHPTNTASNGQYFYRTTATTNESGLGFFTENDDFTGPNWYLVIQADSGTNAIIGCHSEEGVPTNVRVFDFSAVYQPETHTVELAWETASELDMNGFNVLRGTSQGGEPTQINAEMIPTLGPPGDLEGNRYSFTDDALGDAQTYYYWLEIVGTSGRQERVGPEMVTIANAGETYYYYLPLIMK